MVEYWTSDRHLAWCAILLFLPFFFSPPLSAFVSALPTPSLIYASLSPAHVCCLFSSPCEPFPFPFLPFHLDFFRPPLDSL